MNQAFRSDTWRLRRNLRSANPVPLLLTVALALALSASPGRGAPTGQNTLSVGSASGAAGTDVTVALDLANQDAVGGLQLDIRFDPAAVSFTSAGLTARSSGMSLGFSVPSVDTARVLMYFMGGGAVAAGTGAVANLTFHIIGTIGTTLVPDAAELSNPTGQVLAVTAVPGAITVTGGGDPTGACCAPNGGCSMTTQAACTGGAWRGADNPCTPNPCPPPPLADTLAVGVGRGPHGGQVTIPISLTNSGAVRGIQADIRFDQTVLSFESGAAAPRVGAMRFLASLPATGRARIVMYFIDASVLSAGAGPVANLVFRLTGADGSRSSLTPSDIHVAGEYNAVIATFGHAGQITVGDSPPPPDLRLAVLKNPGREHTLQIFLSSDVALDAPPTVSVAGVAVPMTQLPGADIYQGTISVFDGAAAITVRAMGYHDGIIGAAQTTVTF